MSGPVEVLQAEPEQFISKELQSVTTQPWHRVWTIHVEQYLSQFIVLQTATEGHVGIHHGTCQRPLVQEKFKCRSLQLTFFSSGINKQSFEVQTLFLFREFLWKNKLSDGNDWWWQFGDSYVIAFFEIFFTLVFVSMELLLAYFLLNK